MIPQEVSWNSAVYKAHSPYRVSSNCLQTQCMLAGTCSPGCCSVHLVWTPHSEEHVNPNWNMKFSELLLAVAKLGCWCTQIDGVGETASQGSCDSKSQALCVNSLCTSASVSTCNGSRQNFPLAAKLSQQFLGEPFLTANALDTHRYAKCSGYPVHKTVKKQNIHVEIQTSYMELFTCSQLDIVFINSLVLWINKNWKWLIVLPVIPCKWWLDWRL